jgi:hypothetical protein
MKPHKWAKEIKAWADGSEIENRFGNTWVECKAPQWGEQTEYRIKPQPKEPQYLYVYADLQWDLYSYKLTRKKGDFGQYIGKIKLENDDAE